MPKDWKIEDRGEVPESARKIPYECSWCGETALLPVVGHVLAQLAGGGLVFDGTGIIPTEVRCPHCRTGFDTRPPEQQEEASGVR